MASKDTNKTILALGAVAVIGFLAYKLWPAIRRAINAGGGGSGGAGPASIVGGSQSPQQQQQPYSPPSASANFGNGSGSPSSGASLAGALARFISQGSYSNSTPAQQEYIDQQELSTDPLSLSDYPDSIPLEPLQNFDVNQLAYSPDDFGTDTADYSTDADYSDYANVDSVDAGGYIDDGSGDSGDDGGGDDFGGF